MKRVRRPHGLLPKVPEKGEYIVVIFHSHVVQARVQKASGGREIKWRGLLPLVDPNHSRRVHGSERRRDEGLTWARGWDTPAAGALRTFAALS